MGNGLTVAVVRCLATTLAGFLVSKVTQSNEDGSSSRTRLQNHSTHTQTVVTIGYGNWPLALIASGTSRTQHTGRFNRTD